MNLKLLTACVSCLIVLNACSFRPPAPVQLSEKELLRLAQQQQEKGDWQEAQQSLAQAREVCTQMRVEEDTTPIIAHTDAEREAYQNQAEEQQRKIQLVDSDCGDVWFESAHLALQQGQSLLAQTYLDKALLYSPLDSRYLNFHGALLLSQSQGELALAVFEQAEEAAKTYAPVTHQARLWCDALVGAGKSLMALGHWSRAERKFLECQSVQVDDVRVQEQLQLIEQIRNSF